MGQAFKQPLDIFNRALQHCELPRIASPLDMSPNAQECVFAYDKIRRRELRRNVWRFATKRVCLRPLTSTTVLLQPAVFDPTVTYYGGSIVQDGNSDVWINLIPFNLGNTPGIPGSGWDAYFGPLAITPWNNPVPPGINTGIVGVNPFAPIAPGVPYGTQTGSTGYYTGELVYLPDGKGGAQIFRATTTTGNATGSIISPTGATIGATADGPLQVDRWDPSITYAQGQIAFIYTDANGQIILGLPPGLGTIGGLSSNAFESLVSLNTGNQPDICEVSASVPWAAGHTYSLSDIVTGSDTQLYQSLVGSNVGVNPVTDTLFVNWTPLGMFSGTWTTAITPVPRAVSNQWQYIPGTTGTMVIPYPLTAGPLDNTSTRNAFRLPAGYLREAPPDPKRGGIGWLGAPDATQSDQDWTYEGDFIVSDNIQPIIYRFVADVTDVTKMDDMFCEGTAAELAAAVQPILQPGRPELKRDIKAAYEEAIEEARVVNGIETGDVQPPEDEYITCRL